jgi:hypothetical protein
MFFLALNHCTFVVNTYNVVICVLTFVSTTICIISICVVHVFKTIFQIEILNEDLVQFLIARDELAIEQVKNNNTKYSNIILKCSFHKPVTFLAVIEKFIQFCLYFQDSLLTDIEDITKCIGGVRQSLEASII